MSLEKEFRSEIEVHGTFFTISGYTDGIEFIKIQVTTPDLTSRWSGEFNNLLIEDITRKSGTTRKLPVLWHIIYSGINALAKSVTIELLLPSDLSLKESEPNSRMYLVVTVKTDFDQVKYPLPLLKNDLSMGELLEGMRELYAENVKLKASMNHRSLQSLESDILELNSALEKVTNEKDQEIAKLKRKLRMLKSKKPSKPKTQQNIPQMRHKKQGSILQKK